ncbi:MAG: hypothetical protein AMQ22_00082 [Candidatus Methanofastidiosum methylothiophilum]|uniref:Phage-like element PBSX protein XkdF domain-containing protein n=1 Tax=Candidatus Methanofastidiosum methylothiophilum TaxID=1705564 RepID=A0A150J9F5_9EURY|nr:MAG: hypothetical protein AMQ22_00082 [Candidatus Methanofastidiosum methylthiophilus]
MKGSKKAAVPGSFNELMDQIDSQIRENQVGNSDIWVQDIIPEAPVTAGESIIYDFNTAKNFKVPFTNSEKGLELGEAVEVKEVTSYEAVKYAEADGSYEELKSKIKNAINSMLGVNQYVYIQATYPDHVIASVGTEDPVTYEYSRALFNFPYTMDSDGNVILGEPTPVVEVKTFEAVKMGFVTKDEVKREVTTPVMLPGCADCDFNRGEKIFTEDEVAKFCREYNANFRLADKMHILNSTGDIVGESVENWTTKADETVTNVKGETVTLPRGTWMTTIKVTDDATWQQVEEGTLTGASGSYLSRKDADELLKLLSADKRAIKICELVGADKRVLINELDDPVAVSIALVDNPCVPNAIATSIKAASKVGRSFSDTTFTQIQNIKEKISKGLDDLNKLLNRATEERKDPTTPTVVDKFLMEVDKMDENEFNEKVDKRLDEKLKPLTEGIDAIKAQVLKDVDPDESTKSEPDGEPTKTEPTDNSTKSDPKPKPAATKELEKKLETSEKKVEKLEGELASIKEKLGEPVDSNGLKEPEGSSKKKPANKSFMERIGRDGMGRPLKG